MAGGREREGRGSFEGFLRISEGYRDREQEIQRDIIHISVILLIMAVGREREGRGAPEGFLEDFRGTER